MDTSVDYYEVLGVASTASRTELKAAWSALVQKYHPDMGDSTDPKKFMEVQKAFETLSDEKKRADYDRQQSSSTPTSSPASTSTAAPSSPVVEDYVPGWGEAADDFRSAAAPTRPTAKKKSRVWVPPHMRSQTPQTEPTPPVADTDPEVVEKRPAPAERPEAHKSWRAEANADSKPHVVRSWKSLWLPPVIGLVVAVFASLQVFHGTGPGTLGIVTYLLVGLLSSASAIGAIIDWSKVQSGRESITGVAIAGVAAVAVMVLGFGTGNGWAIAAAVAAAFWVGYLNTSLTYKYITTRLMPAKELKQYVAFGKPGKYAASSILQLIEQDFADRLADLFQIPSLRLFHGMGVPAYRSEIKGGESFNSKYGAQLVPNGYIGQAVTAGQKVAFLTSVHWPGGHYSLDNYGGVLVDGQHTEFDLDAFKSDFEHWRRKLKGQISVRLMVVVHSDGPVSFSMPEDFPIELVSADDAVDTLGSWMVDDQHVLDQKLNAVLAEHLAAA